MTNYVPPPCDVRARVAARRLARPEPVHLPSVRPRAAGPRAPPHFTWRSGSSANRKRLAHAGRCTCQSAVLALNQHVGRDRGTSATGHATRTPHSKQPRDLVFVSRTGRRPGSSPREPDADVLLKQADLDHIPLPDLRHSCATLLFSLGGEAATIRRILRHSSLSVTTETYVKLIDSVQHEAVNKLNTLFG